MKFSFKHSVLLAFCAVLIFVVNGLFQHKLDNFTITLTLLFLLFAKSGISHRFSAIATGFLASLLLLLLASADLASLSRTILLPALLIDLLVLIYPAAISSPLRCTLTAGVVASGPALWALGNQLFGGVAPARALHHYLATFGVPTLFAMLGGLPVPVLMSKLKILTPSSGKSTSARKKR